MKLPEVLGVLLKAEDEASEMKKTAEREASAFIQKAREKFARDQEFRLNAAREEARVQVESAKHSVEIEARQIAEMSRKAGEKMQEHFNEHVPALISRIAEDVAAKYAVQGQA
jgi:vacuolar-type H+-ATPase subunit H